MPLSDPQYVDPMKSVIAGDILRSVPLARWSAFCYERCQWANDDGSEVRIPLQNGKDLVIRMTVESMNEMTRSPEPVEGW